MTLSSTGPWKPEMDLKLTLDNVYQIHLQSDPVCTISVCLSKNDCMIANGYPKSKTQCHVCAQLQNDLQTLQFIISLWTTG